MPTIYQLGLSTSACDVTATVNGLPLLTATRAKDEDVSMPLNPLLVGKDNVLLITVTGKGDDARLEGGLTVAGEGDIVETGGGGEFSLPEGAPPQTIEKRFDSSVAPLRAVLDRAAKLDAKAALEFALRLRDLLKKGDTGAVADLFEPKAHGFAAAFEQDVNMMKEGLGQAIAEMKGADLSFGRDALEARPYCDGRIWELRWKDGRPLLVVGPDADGASSQLPVFAADLGDGARVVL